MPMRQQFTVHTSHDIEEYMKLESTKTVYVVMAQPLKEGIPPFILQIFGTNNRFTAENVTNRHKFTILDLKK